MASKACKVSSWRGSGARHAIANASISHWPFVCRPHEAGQAWGGLNHLFGGRSFREVMGVGGGWVVVGSEHGVSSSAPSIAG